MFVCIFINIITLVEMSRTNLKILNLSITNLLKNILIILTSIYIYVYDRDHIMKLTYYVYITGYPF